MSKYNVGNVVSLRSNPEVQMTIVTILDQYNREFLRADLTCNWFDDSAQLQHAHFPDDALEQV